MSPIRQKAIAGLAPGDSFTVIRRLTAEDSAAFGDLSRDFNPVHYDRRFVREKKFRGLICHGLLSASLVTEIGGQLGWLASGMNFKFRKPVYFDDTIECRFTIIEIDDRGRARGEAVYTNQHGEVVLEAEITGVLPSAEERRILAAMGEGA
jgi:3-hydroxybutyryl-CoA dehydratase